jgi:glycosyltransferase involved in cell wall biosynthesis
MNEERKDSGMVAGKAIRPALICSRRTTSEYSLFLKHLLLGFADGSIPAAVVCTRSCSLDSVVSPTAELITHPAYDLPLLWRQSRQRLIEQLEKFRPTVLHCLCESKAPLTRRLSWQLGVPYVLTVNSLQGGFGRVFISWRRCARIIVPAESIAVNLAQVYPRFAERIERINMGTFVEDTAGCFIEPGRLASIVTGHPLEKAGDFDNLLGAIRHLAIDGYEFMLVITGGGRAEQQFRKVVGDLGLSQIVTIVPRFGMWRSLVAAGDIFVRPRPSRAFSPLLLEAMSVGCAVAACKGGVDDLIIADKTAVVFDADDELSMYGILKQLFDARELARRIAEGAQEYLRENHSVSQMVSAILRTYEGAQSWQSS